MTNMSLAIMTKADMKILTIANQSNKGKSERGIKIKGGMNFRNYLI